MNADELMKIVNRYTEACDDLGAGLFNQTEAETAAKHTKATDLYLQIQTEVQRLHADAELALTADAEIESLRAFSRAILECWPDGDVDGGMLQDLAVQHGLLEPQTKTMPCSKESCRCREYYASDQWVDGIICYRRTALVLGA